MPTGYCCSSALRLCHPLLSSGCPEGESKAHSQPATETPSTVSQEFQQRHEEEGGQNRVPRSWGWRPCRQDSVGQWLTFATIRKEGCASFTLTTQGSLGHCVKKSGRTYKRSFAPRKIQEPTLYTGSWQKPIPLILTSTPRRYFCHSSPPLRIRREEMDSSAQNRTASK